VDPAGKRDGLPDVCRAQFVAMMRAFHSNADCGIRIAEFGIQSESRFWGEMGHISKEFRKVL
jgi:hypothetical protein